LPIRQDKKNRLLKKYRDKKMPEQIIKKFEKNNGKKKGKSIFYATANKENRNPETFKKRIAIK
jgi:hypothetical protein